MTTDGSTAKRIRVTFLHKDEQYLYVQAGESTTEASLKVRYGVVDVNAEFNDTVELLWPQAQLNLLDVGIDEAGVLTPKFIVLEPDYLLDASSLAECYKNYGAHPANYLMARLTPAENTLPLLLGNIVNTFLDEWINVDGPDYTETMMKAFRQHPISLSACTDLQDAAQALEFSKACQQHFNNIKKTVGVTFHEPGYQLDKSDAVLEPSYICEPLGIQGRLDYMQRDMHAFIEMKSGKADEYTMPGHALPRENNLVQMLLYQAMLEYTMGIDHRRVKAYLLYTRYPMLYPASPSWTMVHRIINLRNRIVAMDYQVQAHDDEAYTAEVLAQINPQTLNELRLDSKLWTKYQEPQIAAFQHRLQQLTALERSYFYTLYNFITRELYTSKTAGASDCEGRKGQAMQWLGTFEEKLDTGDIMADLQIVENHADDINNPYLYLKAPDAKQSTVNFREGDVIVLYRRDTPDANVTNQLLFKGSIEEICPDGTWKIVLRQPQRNPKVLPLDSRYAFEHDYMDTAYRTMYQGLALFLQASQQRRDLLLGQRQPAHDARYDKSILAANDDFQRITQKALAAKDYFLLVGPPGTGKTSMALRSMVAAFMQRGKQILLLSYTNRAVDEICKMLDKLQVDYLRIGSAAVCAEPYRQHLLEQQVANCNNRREVLQRIQSCHILVGTVSTLSARTSLFSIKHFDVALIDEATQILEPQLLGLLCQKDGEGGDAIRKFILIGDHKQLPAVVQQPASASEVKHPLLRAIGLTNLKDSLFERLYRAMKSSSMPLSAEHKLASPYSVATRHNPSKLGSALAAPKSLHSPFTVDMLTHQGRMHPDVARFANEAFYEGKLQPVGLPHQTEVMAQRTAFFPSVPEPPQSGHKINHDEAKIAAQLAATIYQQTQDFDPQHTLGIITPYRSQIALIRSELSQLGIPALNDITIDTVERYQGSERDIIIYSFCVNRPWQLDQLCNLTEENGHLIDRKLNVALTRARKQLFLTGVPRLLNQHPIFSKLLQYFNDKDYE